MYILAFADLRCEFYTAPGRQEKLAKPDEGSIA
jgi:hypothetical protein